nr:hypothetical protein [Tanacetum cinerariifolium]
MPACFTTFSNILFDADYDFYSVDDQSKIPICYDDDDDYNFAITPNEPVDSLSIGDEHLNTISATESNEFIKSSVKNLVPNPSESEGENGCDMPACFTTFSNILFDVDYDFYSVDDQSLSDEDIRLIERLLYDNSSPRPPKVLIPGLTITRVSNQEKSPDLLSHQSLKIFQLSSECPMMIHGKNIPILDVPLFHFYPP